MSSSPGRAGGAAGRFGPARRSGPASGVGRRPKVARNYGESAGRGGTKLKSFSLDHDLETLTSASPSTVQQAAPPIQHTDRLRHMPGQPGYFPQGITSLAQKLAVFAGAAFQVCASWCLETAALLEKREINLVMVGKQAPCKQE